MTAPTVPPPSQTEPDVPSDGPQPTEGPGAEVVPAGAGDGPGGIAADSPQRRRPSRRKVFLLLLLGLLVIVFGSVAGWYLATRKPITVLPLPGIEEPKVPHYVFSIYGVKRPTGVAVDPAGDRIYITDTDGDRVVRAFDGKGNPVGTIAPPESAPGDHVPVYVAVDPIGGDVYVSDRFAGTIYVYDRDGDYRREFRPPDELAGWQPLGLSFTAAGTLLVTDVGGPFHRLHEFGRDGALLRTIGEAGTFNFPNGAAVDQAGLVYVSDSNNGRLLVFDQAGRQRSMIGRGQRQGELGLPRGVTIDDQGVLYVVDTTGYTVQLYRTLEADDRQPAYIGRFGAAGSLDGAFMFPNGIAVDARARVYVTDGGNNRVQVWSY